MRTLSELLPSKLIAAACLLALFCASHVRAQQETDETIDIKTRVVFVDTLVRDKRTGEPVTNLTQGDFQIFDNKRPRKLTYFSREGNARRPLALMLFLNFALAHGGALRYLERADVQASLAAALRRLAPEDEVALMKTRDGLADIEMRIGLTRDREKVIAELSSAAKMESLQAPSSPAEKPPGTYVMREAIEAASVAQRERPNSQVVVVYISDGFNTFDTMMFDERRPLVEKLLRGNVNFSMLECDMVKLAKVLVPVFDVPLRVLGASLTGGAEHLAKQSGGLNIEVDKPEDYGKGLDLITRSFAARYNLGFTLDESERDDGRMHRLEVKVTARDAKGKKRKLLVNARRGYYAPVR